MKAELSERLILPPKGARVLCAVSGGADSMCLLALLRETGACELAAAHFEHGIRGGESLRDCAFVEDYCRAKGIACFVGHADVPRFAREEGIGLEEAARTLRYAFLEKTAAEHGFDWIATAHSADDNAETALFNFARGAGPAGLCGIPPRRGKIIRPLLGLTRAEIEQFLAESGTPHVEDSTNESDSCSRNRIRHAVMPVLREINPALSEAVARTGRLLRRDEDCLDGLAEDFIEKHFDGDPFAARGGVEPRRAEAAAPRRGGKAYPRRARAVPKRRACASRPARRTAALRAGETVFCPGRDRAAPRNAPRDRRKRRAAGGRPYDPRTACPAGGRNSQPVQDLSPQI